MALVRWGHQADSARRHLLVCFPHAGGSTSSYRDWSIPGVEVAAVCYPGRAQRLAEPCATDLVRLAEEIAADLHNVELPLALFGHSLGAPVALETARTLEAGGRPVTHLFASGSRDGPLPSAGGRQAVGSDDDLLRTIVELGGRDTAPFHDEAFRTLVLPYLRADAELFHGYAMAAKPPLRCPVTTITGVDDNHADLRPWRDLTPHLTERLVPGGHFYLNSSPPLALVAAELGLKPSESEPAS